MVAVGGDEHLGFVSQTAERDGVDDPVAVALENVAWTARAEIGLSVQAAARSRRVRSQRLGKPHSVPSGTISSVGELLHLNAFTPTVSRSWAKFSASDWPRKGPMTSRARFELFAT